MSEYTWTERARDAGYYDRTPIYPNNTSPTVIGPPMLATQSNWNIGGTEDTVVFATAQKYVPPAPTVNVLQVTANSVSISNDPRTGQRHWIIDGPTEQFVASLVYNGQLLFMTAGFPEHHILAIRPDGHGNVTDTHVVWRTTKGCSYVPSPIVSADGRYFLVVSDEGIASCFEAATGQRYWMERIGRHYSASLIQAEGLIQFLADDGTTTIIRPGPKFDVVRENHLGENCYASPAVSHGRIYVRAERNLYCLERMK